MTEWARLEAPRNLRAHPMAALIENLNREKRLYQVTFLPSKVGMEIGALDAFVHELRRVAIRAEELKGSGEVTKVVLLLNGDSGRLGSATSDTLAYVGEKLLSMHDFLSLVDSIFIANPDTSVNILWTFCSGLPTFKDIKSKVKVLGQVSR